MWRLVTDLATLSTCDRLLVGCAVIRPDFTRVLAIGYNGRASGEDNRDCTGAEGACGCIHAEANALIKLETTEAGLILLTTSAPCEHCAGLIVNSRRVGTVVWGHKFRTDDGLRRLAAAGLGVHNIREVRSCGSFSSAKGSTRRGTRAPS